MHIVSGILLVCGILSFLYGIMIWAIQSGSMFFIAWFLLGSVFLLLAAGIHMGVTVPAPIKAALLVLLMIGLLVFLIFEARIVSCFRMRADPGMDYIIVLGAQVKDGGPSAVLKYRLDTACDYLTENPDTRCIVTGAKGTNEPMTEARGMYNYLVSRGIADSRIILEEKAENTVQNLVYSKELLDSEDADVAIVTNNFHLFRALHIADAQGYEKIQGIAAHSTELYLPNNMVREFFGTVKDLLKGNLVW